jgi:hypothetical protein
MGSIWENYESRLMSQGSSLRERKINRLKKRIDEKITSSLSYFTVDISGEEREVTILRSSEGMDYKTMLSMPNETFDRGSLVYWEDNYWLIISHDVQDEIYTRATIQQCNYILTWINEEGQVVTRHCIVTNNDRNSVGEKEATNMTIGDNRLNVILAKDEETEKIYRGKRFLIDDPDAKGDILAYQVTKPDRLPKLYNGKGVYCFGLRECNRSTADNIDLMIADYDLYTQKQESPIVSDGEYTLNLVSEDTSIIIGETLDIAIEMYGNNQNLSDTYYEYSFLEGEDYISVVNANKNSILLKAHNNPANIGKTVELKVVAPSFNVESKIKLTIGGWT